MESTEIRMKNMHLTFHPAFYSEEKCEEIIENLKQINYNSDQESQVFIRGSWIDIPRKQVAFSDKDVRGYRFAGTQVGGQTFPEFLDAIRNDMNEYLIKIGVFNEENEYKINYCLINMYENGEKYIGYHKDDERDLQSISNNSYDNETIILSLSFGETRNFLFKNIATESVVYDLPLKNGDLLIFREQTNKFWKHSLPKRKKSKKCRWNLTFRIMKTEI